MLGARPFDMMPHTPHVETLAVVAFDCRDQASGRLTITTMEKRVSIPAILSTLAIVSVWACAAADRRGPEPPPAPTRLPPGPLAAGCAANSDCVLVEWAGCCDEPCPGHRQAASKYTLEHARQVCAVVECVRQAPVACGRAPNLVGAECMDGACVGLLSP